MSATATPYWKSLSRRYQLDTQAEWRKLLSHFDLSEGFALIVLLVPDADGAALCHRDLETQLRHEDREMSAVEITIPDDLRRLPEHFLDTLVSDNTSCLWLSAVAPDYTPDYTAWRHAWEHALARLNAYRNPIRDRFECTLVFAGAPWLQEVFREIAPDLWSVRTLVVRIETVLQQLDGKALTAPQRIESSTADAPDPQFALAQAEKLRGVEGKELVLADVLHRAGDGFAELEQWREAEKNYAESLELKQLYHAAPKDLLATLLRLSWAYLIRDQTHHTFDLAKQALALSRTTGDRSKEALALDYMGLANLNLGKSELAIQCHEQALFIARELGNQQLECSTLSHLGLAHAHLGETLPGEMLHAIQCYQQALVLARESKNQQSEGAILSNLGNVYSALNETRRAIEYYEQDLKIARASGNRHSKGGAMNNLGNSYSILGEARRAVEYYQQALILFRETGDQRSESNTLWNMSLLLNRTNERQQAIKLATAALQILEQTKDPDINKIQLQLEEWKSEEDESL